MELRRDLDLYFNGSIDGEKMREAKYVYVCECVWCVLSLKGSRRAFWSSFISRGLFGCSAWLRIVWSNLCRFFSFLLLFVIKNIG